MSNLSSLEKQIQELAYEEKAKLFTRCFGFGTIASEQLNDKLILISLVAYAHSRLKVKYPEMKIIDLLVQITKVNKEKSKYLYPALENLAIIIEDLTYNTTEFDSCGLDNSNDIINKIKAFLETWTPF